MDAMNKYSFLGAVAELVLESDSPDRLEKVIEGSVKMVIDLVNEGTVERGTEYNRLIEAITDIKYAKKYKEAWA